MMVAITAKRYSDRPIYDIYLTMAAVSEDGVRHLGLPWSSGPLPHPVRVNGWLLNYATLMRPRRALDANIDFIEAIDEGTYFERQLCQPDRLNLVKALPGGDIDLSVKILSEENGYVHMSFDGVFYDKETGHRGSCGYDCKIKKGDTLLLHPYYLWPGEHPDCPGLECQTCEQKSFLVPPYDCLMILVSIEDSSQR